MAQPRVAVLSGHGINCEQETVFAFQQAGAIAEAVHVEDLIEGEKMWGEKKLADYQIAAFPGGFSYGDDIGAGNALANRMRDRLGDALRQFIEEDKLVIGICNGFQVLVKLGLVPALDNQEIRALARVGDRQGDQQRSQQVALAWNQPTPRYSDRWVDLKISGNGPWVAGIERLSMPIAHGEGRFYAELAVLEQLQDRGLIAARYAKLTMGEFQNLPANPNGSLDNIAGITDTTGKVLGLMPHPERAIRASQAPNFCYLRELEKRGGGKVPVEGDGMKIFKNATAYLT